MVTREDLTKQFGLAHSFAAEIRNLAESIATRLERCERRVRDGRSIGDIEHPGCSDIAERMTRLVRCEGRIEVMLTALFAEESELVTTKDKDGNVVNLLVEVK